MKALALPLRRPVGTAALYAALLLLALYAMNGLPLALAPDTTQPQLSVQVAWANATPEAMEALVTSPIEAEAERLRGVREVSSTSGIGWAEINVQYERGTRMDRAAVFLRERLAALRETLPKGVSPPEITSTGSSDDDGGRFLVLRAGGPRTAEALRQLLLDTVSPRLAAVPGVASVRIFGGGEREIHLDVDQRAVERGQVTPGAVVASLANIGGTRSLGAIVRGGSRLPVVLERPEPRAEFVRAQPVAGDASHPVGMGAIANVRDAWRDPRRLARINGEPAVQVVLEREPGSNVLRVAKAARAALATLRSQLPPDVTIEPIYDQSEQIGRELTALGHRSSWCVAAVFVVLVLSLRRIRAPFAVLGAVFCSALLTFLLFRAMGLGINLVTLSGLALAFGMTVDSSIVLLQSIAQHARGTRSVPWVVAAVRQVLLPLLAGTLTTAVVMVPFLYVSGDLRTYDLPFVLAVCLSLLASFFVGVTLTPLLARAVLGPRRQGAPALRRTGRVTTWWRVPDRLARIRLPTVERLYAPFLDRVLRRPWVPVTIAVVAFAASLWVFHNHVGRGSLFASDPDTGIRVSVALPRGAEIERTDALVSRFETLLLEHPFHGRGYIEQVQAFLWDNRGMLDVRLERGVALSTVPASLQQELVTLAATISGAEINVSGYGPGFSSSRAQTTPSYQLTLRGPDYQRLSKVADDLGRRLGREARVRDIDTNSAGFTVEAATDLALVPDRAALARMGVPMSDFVNAIQPAVAGEFGDRVLNGAEGDVPARIRYGDGRSLTREELLAAFQSTNRGVAVPFESVMRVEERPVQAEIRRHRQQYERLVTFDYRGPRRAGNNFVQSFLAGTALAPGYTVEDGLGLFLTRTEERELGVALALALGLVYMVAAALFESLRLPFVALLALPFGFVGISATFWATGESFDRAAYVGLILLAGIAINSALLLVHRAGSLLRRGLHRTPAIRRAALERCRPILMTTATSVAGLLPLAIANDTGAADTWRALALAACSGLAAAALATLAVVPALFVWFAPRERAVPTLGTDDCLNHVRVSLSERKCSMQRKWIGTLLVAAIASGAHAADTGKTIEAKSPAGKGGYRIQSAVAIGGAQAPDNAQFYEKAGRTDVGADAQGNIYVLDSGGPRVQVFDAAGHFVRSFGKSGEGPGELKMPGDIAVAGDGRSAIFDMALQRITVFDNSGKMLRDQLVTGPVTSMIWNGNDNLVVAMRGPGGDAVQEFDAAGKQLWSNQPADTAPQAGGRRMLISIGNETVGPRLAPGPGGEVFFGANEVYGVQRLARGDIKQTWRRAYERQARQALPQRRSGDDGDGGAQMVVIRREGGGGGADAGHTSVTTSNGAQSSTTTLNMADIEKMLPKFSPDIRGLVAWPDGRLWVVTSTNDGDNMVTDEWSAEGEYLKRFAVPAAYSRLKLGADGKLYGVAHDSDDYPVVHRLDVVPTP